MLHKEPCKSMKEGVMAHGARSLSQPGVSWVYRFLYMDGILGRDLGLRVFYYRLLDNPSSTGRCSLR